MTVAIVLVVAVFLAFLLGGGLSLDVFRRMNAGVHPVAPQPGKWNAWRFPTRAELDAGADAWDLVYLGSAAFPEDAREMLPEQGGQVQEGLTGPVTSYVPPDHELAHSERERAAEIRRVREKAERVARGPDGAA